MTVVGPVERLSPQWWASKLYKRLQERREDIDLFDDYYCGRHPLPWLAPQARDEFRRILRMTRCNYLGLVCDALVERLIIEGFRLGPGEEKADEETWRIYQANNLDADSDKAILEAVITGQSYLLAAPNPQNPATPFMWVEHPSQCIVAFEPGTNRQVRKAGLKVWDDEWTQQLHATLYLMEEGQLLLYKFWAQRPTNDSFAEPSWQPREVPGETWPAKGNMSQVPLIELPNNPRLLTGGVSEIYDVIDIQDRINKTLADRLITQDYGAFPQKWATAWPEEDSAGNPTPPIDIGRNRMVTTDIAETKFGQWEAAALDPYSAAKREDVKDIASRTRTPAQYLLGEMSNVNGETLKASESGLVSKARQRARTFSDGFEDAMRLVREVAGLPGAGTERMETLWRNPEFRTEGELTDSVVKKLQSGISSLRQAREDVGYSQTQIARMEDEDALAAADPVLERIVRGIAEPDVPAVSV